jgi:hypothetical protein
MSHPAKRQDGAQLRHRAAGCGEELAAGADFGGFRLVGRWHATHCIRDHAVRQPRAIIGALLMAALGKVIGQERLMEQHAGIVAGEGWAPVRFAPRSPGARPTIRRRASTSPKGGTGALCQSGNWRRLSWRKATRRGHKGQSRFSSTVMTFCPLPGGYGNSGMKRMAGGHQPVFPQGGATGIRRRRNRRNCCSWRWNLRRDGCDCDRGVLGRPRRGTPRSPCRQGR